MKFNIEKYLNSLPLDTTVIDVSRRGITYLPDLSRFKELTKLDCSCNKLTYICLGFYYFIFSNENEIKVKKI